MKSVLDVLWRVVYAPLHLIITIFIIEENNSGAMMQAIYLLQISIHHILIICILYLVSSIFQCNGPYAAVTAFPQVFPSWMGPAIPQSPIVHVKFNTHSVDQDMLLYSAQLSKDQSWSTLTIVRDVFNISHPIVDRWIKGKCCAL